MSGSASDHLRVVTWNVNSIRTRQGRVLDWIDRHEPDVVLLQETKCSDAVVDASDLVDGYRERGYEFEHHGRDHWNGVAIVSRVGIDDVRRGFDGPNGAPFDECRVMSALCGGVRVVSLYAPNGRTLDDPHYLFKLVWFERLRSTLAGLLATDAVRPGVGGSNGGPVLVAGDFNVAPEDIDVYDPVRWRRLTHASPPERAAIRALLELGLHDVTRERLPEPGVYTWWSYRPGQVERNRGLRIDLALTTSDLADRVRRVWIDLDERTGERPSDHAPLVIDLDRVGPSAADG